MRKKYGISIAVIIFFGIMSAIYGNIRRDNIIAPMMDYIGVEYTLENGSLPIAVCLNEIIQQEEWTGAEFKTGEENEEDIEIAEHDSFESITFRFIHNDKTNPAIIFRAIRFKSKDETVCEFKGKEMERLFANAENYNFKYEYDDESEEMKLQMKDWDEVMYCRINEQDIDRINNQYLDWKDKKLSEIETQMQLRNVQITILISVVLFWLIVLGKSIGLPVKKCFLSFFTYGSSNEKMHYDWIYLMRGMAIIGVVVCHQLHYLHDTEYIQMFSLYSVPIFVLCMGITKALSINTFINTNERNWLRYTVRSLKSILGTYIFATVCYLAMNAEFNYWKTLQALFNFSATAPFYFVELVIVFSIYAPFLFTVLKWIEKAGREIGPMLRIIFLITVFIIGYISLERLSIFGGSFLAIYTGGMMFGMNDFPKVSLKSGCRNFLLFLIGTACVYQYYFDVSLTKYNILRGGD